MFCFKIFSFVFFLSNYPQKVMLARVPPAAADALGDLIPVSFHVTEQMEHLGKETGLNGVLGSIDGDTTDCESAKGI